MKKLGIIGGLGPMATAYFMRRIIEMTDAKTDQDNIEMIVYNCPSIPDRTGYILGECKDSPLPKMIEIAKSLESQSIDYIAIPCITAHYFHEQLSESVSVPISNGIRETAEYLSKEGINKVGIMATTGTVKTHLFDSIFKEYGIECTYPIERCQELLMDIIYKGVKAGNSININDFLDVRDRLIKDGAQVVILGCTELSIVKRDNIVGDKVLDIIDVLAQDCVSKCASLRPEFQDLITK